MLFKERMHYRDVVRRWKLFEDGGVVTFVAEDALPLWLVFWLVSEFWVQWSLLCRLCLWKMSELSE